MLKVRIILSDKKTFGVENVQEGGKKSLRKERKNEKLATRNSSCSQLLETSPIDLTKYLVCNAVWFENSSGSKHCMKFCKLMRLC